MRNPALARLVLVALPLAAVPLVACGGGGATPEAQEGGDVQPGAASAGGEAPVEHPIRTTTPVPVPQPAVAREEMSEPLQGVWTQIEETVALRPPDPPSEPTEEAVQAWSTGPFTRWLDQRREHMSRVIATSEGVEDTPRHERAVTAALMGYAMEDLAADVRGAPIPNDISADPELLQIYVDNLREVLRPIATEAVVYYAYCQRRLAAMGDESPWLPWRAYCVQRGREMIEVYALAPPEDGATPEEDGEGAGEAPEDAADVLPADAVAAEEEEPSS